MVAVDMGFLILLFGERGTADDRAKVDHLVTTLEKSAQRIVVPTPALAEYLVRAHKASSQILQELWRRDVFRVCSFDEKAAVECSILMKAALDLGDKRSGSRKDWQAVKFDYQIVAIARANGAKTLYSNDGPLRGFAEASGLLAISLSDLQLPPAAAQQELAFNSPSIATVGAAPSVATPETPSEASSNDAGPEAPAGSRSPAS